MAVRAHQLQIVDHNHVQPVLHFQPSAAGAKLRRRDAGRIVDIDIGGRQRAERRGQRNPVVVAQRAMANGLHVHARIRAQKAHRELILRHFQRENRRRLARHRRRVADQVHAKARLAHRRARADNHQFASMQASQQVIQIHKARRHTVDAALQLGQLLNAQIGIRQNVRNMRQRASLVTAHDDIKNRLFRHAEDVAHCFGLLIACGGDVPRRLNHAAQRRLFIHNLHIGARVDRRRHALAQFDEIVRAADALQRAAPGQLVIHRHQINGHALRIERMHRVENFPVCGLIEIIRRKQLKGQRQRLSVLHHAAQHAFFRIGIVGRYTHNCLVHNVLPF